MARTKLIIAVIVLLSGSQASAGVVIFSVDVVPEQPLGRDIITFNISGGAITTPSQVEYDEFSQSGTSLQLDLHVWRGPWLATSGWSYSKQIQPLLPGAYTLTVRAFDMPFGQPPPGTLDDTHIIDFTVVPAGDLNNDRWVDFLDYALLAEAWMSEPGDDNWEAACDISEPNDDIIDGRDLGVIGGNWLTGLPSITYEIEQCDMLGGASGVLEELRFTVWVEGDYIYFEDMMVANCCPDELAIEMSVDGNVITIRETERLTMPCLCICDYPVEARFGPFEDGVYTVEVYEDHGGFIGSTTVEIGGG